MAEEPKSVCEWLDIELDKLSSDDKITLISEIGDTLNAQELIRVRTLADNLRLEKLDEARSALAAKIQVCKVYSHLGEYFQKCRSLHYPQTP